MKLYMKTSRVGQSQILLHLPFTVIIPRTNLPLGPQRLGCPGSRAGFLGSWPNPIQQCPVPPPFPWILPGGPCLPETPWAPLGLELTSLFRPAPCEPRTSDINNLWGSQGCRGLAEWQVGGARGKSGPKIGMCFVSRPQRMRPSQMALEPGHQETDGRWALCAAGEFSLLVWLKAPLRFSPGPEKPLRV